MINFKTRTAALIAAFGIFFASGCASFNTSIQKAEQLFENNNYSSAIEQINQHLRNHPDDADALLLKIRVLDKFASSKNAPDDRYDLYEEMKNTHENILFIESPEIVRAQSDSIVNTAWNREQQMGVQLLQEDESEGYDQNFKLIISHLNNALLLNPRNETTYNLIASTYYRHKNISNAITTLESAKKELPIISDQLREKLAYFYLESGNIAEAIHTYEELLANSPDNRDYVHGLVNSYILDNSHEKAIELLEKLIEENPANDMYKEILISEKLFYLNSRIESILAERSAEFKKSDFDEFVQIYNGVEELNSGRNIHQSTDFDLFYSIAGQYKNSASSLLMLSGEVTDDSSLSNQIRHLAENFLTSSLTMWEHLAENYPENREIFKNLYQIYMQLDMNDNAEMIRQNYNF
ncbi:MAG: tetratricopeptide repeat protein [Balneolaceae bacterium]